MRRDTKFAIGIGVVAVALGAWYLNLDKTALPEVASPDADKAQVAKDPAKPVSPVADSSHRSPQGSQLSTKTRMEKPKSLPTLPSSYLAKTNAESLRRPTNRPLDDKAVRAASPTPARVGATVNQAYRPTPAMYGTRLGAATKPAAMTPRIGLGSTARPIPNRSLTYPRPHDAATTQPAMIAAAKRAAPPKEPVARTMANLPKDRVPTVRQHVIAPGDTYSALATRYLGDAKLAGLIANANPGVDPRRLGVGARINIPPSPKALLATGTVISAAPNINASPGQRSVPKPKIVPSARAYTVQPGQGWYDLAKKFLKDGNRWPELYELNRERVSRDPNMLRAGTVIELPNGVTPKP